MKTLNQSYFMRQYQQVNTHDYAMAPGGRPPPGRIDAEAALENAEYSASISRQAIAQVKAAGACLLQFNPSKGYDRIFAWQQTVFGDYIFDSAVSGQPFSEIVAKEDGKYFANTNLGQPMHSDDAHTADAPRLISLYCMKQSLEGGVSTLVNLYGWLRSMDFEGRIDPRCYAADALQIQGARGALSRPLLLRDGEEALCAFPSILREVTGEDAVIDLYSQVQAWAQQPSNQMRFRLAEGQLLLIDNYKVLHGRTGFRLEDPRLLFRACFDDRTLRVA